MIVSHLWHTRLLPLLLLLLPLAVVAQPTLPDITGSAEKGIVLLSWTCQYDGVKSIAVLRSAEININYSTVGYVKKLYKGVQAFADGHPMEGRNYYKLSIVFNSGLTWSSNYFGVDIDPEDIKNSRFVPPNEALQKLIVTDNPEVAKTAKAPASTTKQKTTNTTRAATASDRDKYTEVFRKDTVVKPIVTVTAPEPDPKYMLKLNQVTDDEAILESIPEETNRKMTLSVSDEEEVDADDYMETQPAKPEQKKKINITFNDQEDVSAFLEAMPKSDNRKITISYSGDTGMVNAANYIDEKKKTEEKKKLSITLKDDAQVQAYMDSLPRNTRAGKITVSYSVDSAELSAIKKAVPAPKQIATPSPPPPPPPKTRISLKFNDETETSRIADIKAKYVSIDPATGHVRIFLPDDIFTHNYSMKFFDKDNRQVIEVPKMTAPKIIMDKRNFQKKGTYKFTIRKDYTELESGYITIY